MATHPNILAWKIPWTEKPGSTLSDPMDCSLPGSAVREIFQERALEWVAIILLQGIFLTQESNPMINHNGKEHFKKNVYICITKSLCYTAEINISL